VIDALCIAGIFVALIWGESLLSDWIAEWLRGLIDGCEERLCTGFTERGFPRF
jgi:hypothetical protein